MAGAFPAALPGHRGRPSPTTATSSTTPPSGSSNSTAAWASPTRATIPTGWTRRRSAWSEQKKEDARIKAMKEELKWVRSNAKGRQTKSKARLAPLRGTERRRLPAPQRDQRDLHPGGRAPGQRRSSSSRRQQELRRPAADRQPQLPGSGRRHRRHHRPQRRRQVDAVPHDPGRREARFGRGASSARPPSWPSSTSPRPDLANDKTVWEDVSGGSTTSSSASS